MTKKEKIIAGCCILSMALVIISTVYTLYANKPEGYIFRYQKIMRNINL